MVERAGFEPAKPLRAPDLQSGGINHSPISPWWTWWESNPLQFACKANRLPQPQALILLVDRRGFEPLTSPCKGDIFPVKTSSP